MCPTFPMPPGIEREALVLRGHLHDQLAHRAGYRHEGAVHGGLGPGLGNIVPVVQGDDGAAVHEELHLRGAVVQEVHVVLHALHEVVGAVVHSVGPFHGPVPDERGAHAEGGPSVAHVQPEPAGLDRRAGGRGIRGVPGPELVQEQLGISPAGSPCQVRGGLPNEGHFRGLVGFLPPELRARVILHAVEKNEERIVRRNHQ
jgi:hypothetical protein